MILFELRFDFETAESGTGTVCCPTRRNVMQVAASILEGRCREDISSGADDAPEHSAELWQVRTVRLDARHVCDILNSSGGRYTDSARLLGTFTAQGCKETRYRRSFIAPLPK